MILLVSPASKNWLDRSSKLKQVEHHLAEITNRCVLFVDGKAGGCEMVAQQSFYDALKMVADMLSNVVSANSDVKQQHNLRAQHANTLHLA